MKKQFTPKNRIVSILLFCLTLLIVTTSIKAQTTAFTYQGRFADATVAQPTNGTYSMTFRLYDALTGGNKIGSDLVKSVSVANGIFTVSLDFGATAFNTTSARYLEIQVGATAVLTPRQEIASVPFAQRATNASAADSLSTACVGCVTNANVASGISYAKLTGAPTSLPPSGAAGGDLTGTFPNPTIAVSAVTSSKILDGTIVNGDISTTAAIDGTKVVGSTITGLNASNLTSGTVSDARLSGNVTVQGNTFNGTNQLVKTDGTGKLPAIDGSLLTNVSAAPSGMTVNTIPASSATYTVSSYGNTATRVYIFSLSGGNGSGLTIILSLPAANAYPRGTVLRFVLTDYITLAPTVQYQRSNTTDLLHGFNQGSGAAGPGFPGNLSSWITDGTSNWYKIN